MTYQPQAGLSVDGTVIGVHDGDTIKIKIEVVFDLRLKQMHGGGCYAPEITGKSKKRGVASRDHLKAICLGKRVRVFIPFEGAKKLGDISSLSRELGDAWVEDAPDFSLSELQIKNGHATLVKEE